MKVKNEPNRSIYVHWKTLRNYILYNQLSGFGITEIKIGTSRGWLTHYLPRTNLYLSLYRADLHELEPAYLASDNISGYF